MNDTLTLLKQHHNDGEKFVELMKNSAIERFNAHFWDNWAKWLTPVLSEIPQIADFGCGPGMLLQLLRTHYPQAHLIGVEYAPYMLEALDKEAFHIVVHDLHESALPIRLNSIDVITLSYCLHELSQPVTALQSAYEVLKPGGRCLIMDWVRVPLITYLTSQTTQDILTMDNAVLKDTFTHFTEHNRYHADDVSWLLQKVGFTILEQAEGKSEQFMRWVVEK